MRIFISSSASGSGLKVETSAAELAKAAKSLQSVFTSALKEVGLQNTRPFIKTAHFKKRGVFLHMVPNVGTLYDHTVPLKDRADGRTAPKFLGWGLDVFSNGESEEPTTDGPVGVDKLYYSHFDRVPPTGLNAQYVKSLRAAMVKAAKEASTEYEKAKARLSK